MSYLTEIQDTIPAVRSYFWKEILQKKRNLVLQSWSNPASVQNTYGSSALHERSFFPWEKRKWNDILACRSFNGDSLSAEISKLCHETGTSL